MPDEPASHVRDGELAVPPGADLDPKAVEVIRVWAANNGIEVALRPAFSRVEAWGMLLVDIARHAARMLDAEGRCSETEALARIKAMFDDEWSEPTDIGTTRPHHKN